MQLRKLRSKVGLVFQYPEHQLFETDIFKDVCFGPKNLGLDRAETELRAFEALRLVGLDESLYYQSPFDLSGGQKRRVAIAGVLAMKPEVLILDEPTAGLDPKGRDDILDCVKKLQKETGVHIKFINLSGGVGIPYKPDQEPNDIRAIGDGVRRVYEEVLVPAGMGDVAIYTEMGRFMMGPYGCLVTTAIHEKHTHKEYIGVDACAVNLMRPAMYGAYHHITVMGKEIAPCDHKYDITGSLCENNDKFAIDRMLPKIDMGDVLVIHDTGAHGFSMGYNYNGKLKSAEVLLKEDGTTQLIRRAETPADYFATFDCFDIGKKLIEK